MSWTSRVKLLGLAIMVFRNWLRILPERYGDVDTKLEMVVHAEENAILGAGTRARGGTIYVSGKPICARCAGSVIQSGLRRAVAQEPKEGSCSKWDKSGQIARQMMEEAKIEFVPISK